MSNINWGKKSPFESFIVFIRSNYTTTTTTAVVYTYMGGVYVSRYTHTYGGLIIECFLSFFFVVENMKYRLTGTTILQNLS